MISKTRPGASELARPKQSFAALERATNAGQQLWIADGVNQRAAGANLRAGDALHDGVGPADQALGRDGDDRLLHGIEHGGQLLAAAFELGEALAEALGGLIESGLHGESSSSPAARAARQVAVGDAPGKVDHALKAKGDAAGYPGGEGNCDR